MIRKTEWFLAELARGSETPVPEKAKTQPMQLVEQHIIRKSDPRFPAIDRAAFWSKNLYNATNYLLRQSFISRTPTSLTPSWSS